METSELISRLRIKGFEVFENPEGKFVFNYNIVGCRSLNSRVNYFDDTLVLFWQTFEGKWASKSWPITTMPGLPSLLKPINPHGTAILKEGQYKKSYSLGLHRGKYQALIQIAPVTVYRDNNRDDKIELLDLKQETGMFGINIHKAGVYGQIVGPSSAGCQVFQKAADFEEFMVCCRNGSADCGNKFTYTLIWI